jgi:uncharacterized protein YjbI with pentapeptide repeats
MANPDHIAQLKKGVEAWNAWREDNPDIRPDLSQANLGGADLGGANLSKAYLAGANLSGVNLSKAYLAGANLNDANLKGANVRGADLVSATLLRANLNTADLGKAYLFHAVLYDANLSGADLGEARFAQADLRGVKLNKANLREADLFKAQLRNADLSSADLYGAGLTGAELIDANLTHADLRKAQLDAADLNRANLSGADLGEADLTRADLREANLNQADLSGANLTSANLLETTLRGADLTSSRVYGVSAWGLKLEGVKQHSLIITPADQPAITVDNIEVAQFIYLLLHNEKIRDVIDTIGKKGVLLLGRFTEGRIQILERLREKLRSLDFVPMVFNFDKPETKDFTETVRLLANLSRFVIVDITNPRSTPLELQATVPDYMVPFVPILEKDQAPFAMFVDLQNKYDWVLDPVIVYPSADRLIEVTEDKIVRPAEAKFNELLARRTKQLRVETV